LGSVSLFDSRSTPCASPAARTVNVAFHKVKREFFERRKRFA
jgi:hypothetical protein